LFSGAGTLPGKLMPIAGMGLVVRSNAISGISFFCFALPEICFGDFRHSPERFLVNGLGRRTSTRIQQVWMLFMPIAM